MSIGLDFEVRGVISRNFATWRSAGHAWQFALLSDIFGAHAV